MFMMSLQSVQVVYTDVTSWSFILLNVNPWSHPLCYKGGVTLHTVASHLCMWFMCIRMMAHMHCQCHYMDGCHAMQPTILSMIFRMHNHKLWGFLSAYR